MADSGLKEQITAIMDKAERSLNAANKLLDEKNSDFSSSRSYYAAFYAIQALMLTKNLVYSKHAGVISGFNEHFIRKNIFPKDFSKHISRLFRERHIGDYDFEQIIKKEDAQKDHAIASELVIGIRKYLIKEGFIE
jgi:uncharacterized protein (UPF0332 family)